MLKCSNSITHFLYFALEFFKQGQDKIVYPEFTKNQSNSHKYLRKFFKDKAYFPQFFFFST